MNHIRVNDSIRLETVKVSMAPVIFQTIEHDRNFLRKWLPFVDLTHRISDTEDFLRGVVNQPVTNKNEVYSIWYREEFAGLIGFKDSDWTNHKTELGYWIAKKMQGKGIVTSSLKELLKLSFTRLRFNRIQIKVAVENTKSAAVAQRLGFKMEGIEREGEFHKSGYLDLQVYSLLKSEWLKQ